MVIFRENTEDIYAGIEYMAGTPEVRKVIDFLKKGREGKDKIPGKHGAKSRNYSYLPIVIDDKPGQLAIIFNECAKINVNIEDLSIEHSPGQETGLITLAVSRSDAATLKAHLESEGWDVHAPRS